MSSAQNLKIRGGLTVLDGITFAANPFGQSPANPNNLYDYEEGTWTPVFGNPIARAHVQSATYTKVGNRVTISAFLYGNNQTNWNVANGFISIFGLPFPSVDYCGVSYISSNNIRALIRTQGAGTELAIISADTGNLVTYEEIGTDNFMIFSLTYQTPY